MQRQRIAPSNDRPPQFLTNTMSVGEVCRVSRRSVLASNPSWKSSTTEETTRAVPLRKLSFFRDMLAGNSSSSTAAPKAIMWPSFRDETCSDASGDDGSANDIAAMTEAVVRLKLDLAEFRSALDASKQANLGLREELAEAAASMEAITAERDALVAQSSETLARAEALSRSLSRAQKSLHNAALERTRLRVEAERLEAERDDYRNRCRGAEGRAEMVRREKERLERVCVELRYDRADLTKQCQMLSDANEKLMADANKVHPGVAQQETVATKQQTMVQNIDDKVEINPKKEGGDREQKEENLEEQLQAASSAPPNNFGDSQESFSHLDHYEDIFHSMRKIAAEKVNAKNASRRGSNLWSSLRGHVLRPRKSSDFTASTETLTAGGLSGAGRVVAFGNDSLVLDEILTTIENERYQGRKSSLIDDTDMSGGISPWYSSKKADSWRNDSEEGDQKSGSKRRSWLSGLLGNESAAKGSTTHDSPLAPICVYEPKKSDNHVYAKPA